MWVLSGTQRHMHCLVRGYKCFARHVTFSLRLTANCFSLNLKQHLTIGVLLVVHNQFLHVWLVYIVFILKVVEESQEDAENLRHHKAHGGLKLLVTHRKY